MSFSHGVVKCVLSGDTLVIRGRPVSGPPPEKQVSLSFVSAPRTASLKKLSDEQPFAYAAREYLRKTVVGKQVQFRVDSKSQTGQQQQQQQQQREFVTILLPPAAIATAGSGAAAGDATSGKAVNLAVELVAHGLARVSARKDDEPNLPEGLLDAEATAQAEAKGIWSKDTKVLAENTLPVQYALAVEPSALLSKYKKQPVQAIVEQVRDASTLRLMLLPERQMITLFISGIKAPAVKRDNVPDSVSEPFAEEAKFFTETRLLQCEVKVVLEDVASNNQNFIGSIIHPNGNIAEALLANGFASCWDASITGAFGGPQKLRDAERSAKEKRIRLWREFTPKAAPKLGHASEFVGVVTKIYSGDTIAVVPTGGKDEVKLTMSSIRQPKMKDPKEGFYNGEAKEFLRSRLIGNKVQVSIEYVRPPAEGFEEKVCGTVMLGKMNVAEALLNKGLAAVLRMRKDSDERSRFFDDLMLAEEKAQKEKKGIFSDKEPPVVRISDASENATKARSFLTSYKRTGRIPAVVEYIFNASRFKIWLPKENNKLTLVLGGVRCPRPGKGATEKGEPFGQEASDFVSAKCFQRDVEIEVENVDKTGAFIGTIWLKNNENLSVSLLEEGYAFIHTFSAEQSPYTNQLFSAETRAKTTKKNVWSTYVEAVEEPEDNATEPPADELIDVAVSEMVDGGHFYVQVLGSGTEKLENLMTELNAHCKSAAAQTPISFKPGDLIAAKYPADNAWYRAKVKRVLSSSKQVEIYFVDYGNSDTVAISNTRNLGLGMSTLPGQAVEAFLSFVQVPAPGEDYGAEAMELASELLQVPRLKANVDYRVGNVSYLTAFLSEGNASSGSKDRDRSVNAEMLRHGLAQLAKKFAKKFTSRVQAWKPHQEHARTRRLGMFEYGDFALEEEAGF